MTKPAKTRIAAPPATPPRVETAPTVFGDDYTGFFMRGDHACAYAANLTTLLDAIDRGEPPPKVVVMLMHALAKDMATADDRGERPGLQRFRPFAECVIAAPSVSQARPRGAAKGGCRSGMSTGAAVAAARKAGA